MEKMLVCVTKMRRVTTCDSESLSPSVVEPLYVGSMEISCHTLSHRHTGATPPVHLERSHQACRCGSEKDRDKVLAWKPLTGGNVQVDRPRRNCSACGCTDCCRGSAGTLRVSGWSLSAKSRPATILVRAARK